MTGKNVRFDLVTGTVQFNLNDEKVMKIKSYDDDETREIPVCLNYYFVFYYDQLSKLTNDSISK